MVGLPWWYDDDLRVRNGELEPKVGWILDRKEDRIITTGIWLFAIISITVLAFTIKMSIYMGTH